jgi:hypothetical protein
MEIERAYGVATTILFPLIDRGTLDFESTPVSFVAADTQISKDEGAFANTGSTPSHEGNGIYSLALTATEMQAARIAITCIDSATKTWEDQAIIIRTYGDDSAQFIAEDLSGAIVSGLAQTGTLTTTSCTSDLSEATNDHYNGRTIIFITGNLLGQASDVTDYVGKNGQLTYTQLTEAPANNDRFILVSKSRYTRTTTLRQVGASRR